MAQWIEGPYILNQYLKIMEASILPYTNIYIYLLNWASSSSEKIFLKTTELKKTKTIYLIIQIRFITLLFIDKEPDPV